MAPEIREAAEAAVASFRELFEQAYSRGLEFRRRLGLEGEFTLPHAHQVFKSCLPEVDRWLNRDDPPGAESRPLAPHEGTLTPSLTLEQVVMGLAVALFDGEFQAILSRAAVMLAGTSQEQLGTLREMGLNALAGAFYRGLRGFPRCAATTSEEARD